MHWIEEWRTSYRRRDGKIGLSRGEFARKVRTRKLGCSPKLIEMLEHGDVTHPKIADRIAFICNATDEQYDQIVPDVHKGKRRRRREWVEPKPIHSNAIAVVAMDELGREIGRYDSICAAATEVKVAAENVKKRCSREMLGNEYKLAGRTWRYAQEYDGMNAAQRICDALEAAKPLKQKEVDKK